jgi:hypothetical protein
MEDALNDFNIPYIKEDAEFIFRGLDINGDGVVDSNEYINAICGEFTQYRSDRVELAW